MPSNEMTGVIVKITEDAMVMMMCRETMMVISEDPHSEI